MDFRFEQFLAKSTTITVFSDVDTPSPGFSTTTVSRGKEELGPGWAMDDVYPPLAELRRALLTDEEWAAMSSWEKDVWEMFYRPDWERLACIEQILEDTPPTQRAERHAEILEALRSLGASASVSVDHLDDRHAVSVDAVSAAIVEDDPEVTLSVSTDFITTVPVTCSTDCSPQQSTSVLVASSPPIPFECVHDTNNIQVAPEPLAVMGEVTAVLAPTDSTPVIQLQQLYSDSGLFRPSASQCATITNKVPLPRPMPWPSLLDPHPNGDVTRPLPWPSFREEYDHEAPSVTIRKSSQWCNSDSSRAESCAANDFQISDLCGSASDCEQSTHAYHTALSTANEYVIPLYTIPSIWYEQLIIPRGPCFVLLHVQMVCENHRRVINSELGPAWPAPMQINFSGLCSSGKFNTDATSYLFHWNPDGSLSCGLSNPTRAILRNISLQMSLTSLDQNLIWRSSAPSFLMTDNWNGRFVAAYLNLNADCTSFSYMIIQRTLLNLNRHTSLTCWRVVVSSTIGCCVILLSHHDQCEHWLTLPWDSGQQVGFSYDQFSCALLKELQGVYVSVQLQWDYIVQYVVLKNREFRGFTTAILTGIVSIFSARLPGQMEVACSAQAKLVLAYAYQRNSSGREQMVLLSHKGSVMAPHPIPVYEPMLECRISMHSQCLFTGVMNMSYGSMLALTNFCFAGNKLACFSNSKTPRCGLLIASSELMWFSVGFGVRLVLGLTETAYWLSLEVAYSEGECPGLHLALASYVMVWQIAWSFISGGSSRGNIKMGCKEVLIKRFPRVTFLGLLVSAYNSIPGGTCEAHRVENSMKFTSSNHLQEETYIKEGHPVVKHTPDASHYGGNNNKLARASPIWLTAWTLDGLGFSLCCGQAPFQGGRYFIRAGFSNHVHVSCNYYLGHAYPFDKGCSDFICYNGNYNKTAELHMPWDPGK